MGYYSHAQGSVKITPPITYKELIDAGYDIENAKTNQGWDPFDYGLTLRDGWGELFFQLETENRDTDSGRLQVIWTDTINANDESMKMYEIVKSAQTAVRDFGDTHSFHGTVIVFGEEGGDIWRLRFDGGNVYEEHPELRWPDGSTSDVRR